MSTTSRTLASLLLLAPLPACPGDDGTTPADAADTGSPADTAQPVDTRVPGLYAAGDHILLVGVGAGVSSGALLYRVGA